MRFPQSMMPAEYDARVKAMEVDERPTEQYSDIGGLDKQIQELIEAVVLPMTHKEKFKNLGIHPPKGGIYIIFTKWVSVKLIPAFSRCSFVRPAWNW